MRSVYENYKKFYAKKEGGQNVTVSKPKITVTVKTEDEKIYSNPELDKVNFDTRVIVNDHVPDVRNMIRQLLDQESTIKNQREKYRMNYYRLEAQKADKSEFIKNFNIIKHLTDQLAPVYIQRKRIEQSGKIEIRKEITLDEENEVRRLKYDKKRLIDRKSKLQKKIDTYMSFAKGPQNLGLWQADLEAVRLDIYDIEEKIKKIEGE